MIFLPPNVTSRYQPMDMGIIVCLKVGYCVQLIGYILLIFDVEECYEGLETHREIYKHGWKVLHVGGNPTMFNLVDLSVGIWNGDEKYD